MIGFEEALARVKAAARPLGSEIVPFGQAPGRILAEPVTARFRMPRTNVSAMDGYAVRESDLGDLPFSLPVAGESAAGAPPGQALPEGSAYRIFTGAPVPEGADRVIVQALPEGSAYRIFTGAPVPEGADRVIVQENTERDAERVTFVRPHGRGRNIRTAGSDFQAGDVLVPAGVELDWRALTTAAAADRAELCVYRQPRVVILATGDELAAPGEAHARAGAIPESVRRASPPSCASKVVTSSAVNDCRMSRMSWQKLPHARWRRLTLLS